MKILVACEESQAVTRAFREKGHEAFSCDVQMCSGGKYTNGEYRVFNNKVLQDQKTRSRTFQGIACAMAEQWG